MRWGVRKYGSCQRSLHSTVSKGGERNNDRGSSLAQHQSCLRLAFKMVVLRRCAVRTSSSSPPPQRLPPTPPSKNRVHTSHTHHYERKSLQWTFFDASAATVHFFFVFLLPAHPHPSIHPFFSHFKKHKNVNIFICIFYVFQVYPESSSQKTIFSSVVYCIHRKEGCEWSGELRKLKVN